MKRREEPAADIIQRIGNMTEARLSRYFRCTRAKQYLRAYSGCCRSLDVGELVSDEDARRQVQIEVCLRLQ